MKKITISIAALFWIISLHAQKTIWLKPITGASEVKELHMAMDHTGNTYVLGNFKGQASIGKEKYFSVNTSCIVFKVDSSGENILWSTQFTSPENLKGNKIAVDSEQNIAIVGDFKNEIKNKNIITNSNNGSTDWFTAYINAKGKTKWIKQGGGAHPTQPEQGISVSFDGSGNVLAIGNISGNQSGGIYNYMAPSTGNPEGSATFDNENIENITTGIQAVITKIKPSGEVVWVNSKIKAGASDVDTDKEGNIYLAGSFYNYSKIFDLEISSAGVQSVYILKIDSEGNFIWLNKFGAKGEGNPGQIPVDQTSTSFNGIQVSETGEIIATGSTTASIYDQQGNLLGSEISSTSSFALHLNNKGTFKWLGAGYGLSITGCDIDNDGNSYLAVWGIGREFFEQRMKRPTVYKISPEGKIAWSLTKDNQEIIFDNYEMTGFSELILNRLDNSIILETTTKFDKNYVIPENLEKYRSGEAFDTYVSLQKIK